MQRFDYKGDRVKVISVSLPSRMVEQLKELAKENNCSVSAIHRLAVIEHLKEVGVE